MTAAVGPGSEGSRGIAPARTVLPGGGSLRDQVSAATDEWRRAPAHLATDLMALGLATAVFRAVDPEGGWWWGLLAPLPPWWARLLAVWQMSRAPRLAAGTILRWRRGNARLVLVQAFPLGLCCALFQPGATGLQQATLLVVLFMTALAAVPTLALQPPVFALHVALVTGPMAMALALDRHDPDLLHLTGTLVVMLALVFWMAESFRAAVRRLSALKDQAHLLRRELASQAAASQAARLEAEALDRARTRWVAAATHDLRQPLLALQLYGHQLRARLSSPDDIALLHGFEQSRAALEQMSGDLLALARCDSGVAMHRPRWMTMAQVYDRLAPQMAPAAFDRGLLLHWRGWHHRLHADPDFIERCLRNLVINALNHTHDGGVLVAARCHGGQIRLQVWDTGVGVPPEWQPRLFDDYFQVPQPVHPPASPQPAWFQQPGRSSPDRGWGLGLSIVRRLAHLMGAELRVRSQPGRGSLFELRLPVVPEGANGSAQVG